MTTSDKTPSQTTGSPEDDRGDADDHGFLGHPRGLSVLFFSEMWERFSYYGMRALLVLYMVYEFGYPEDPKAYGVYGAYGALVYALPVIGGWLANQWLGYRRAIIIGGVFMALGHFAMAVPHEIGFYLALALICVGNGFFKPNISSTVGRLYRPGDLRRDRGFTIFYMAINIGAFSGPLIAGLLGEKVDWHLGFTVAGVGMVAGLIRFVYGQRTLGEHGEPDDRQLLHAPVIGGLNRLHLVIIGAALVAPLAACSLYWYQIAQYFIVLVSVIVLVMLIVFTVLQKGVARMRMIALMALMFFHMVFWAGFEQAGSSFNILTKEYVDRDVGSITLGATAFQSVNPLFIILLAPLFNLLWKHLQIKGWNPSVPMKFALGLFQLGIGFWVLSYGISRADSNAEVALLFMVLCYFFHTTGELCLSPIGLSAVTKLAPLRWVGFCMGAWFLTMANAHLLAAAIAKLTASGGGGASGQVTRADALAQYGTVFQQVFYMAMISGVILMALTPLIKRLMRGVE